MAKLGIGLLVIPQKPWENVEEEIGNYKRIYREVNNEEPPTPIIAGWTMCDTDKDRAYEKAKQWIGGYWQTVLDHYNFDKPHLIDQKGYEYYGGFAKQIESIGIDGAIEYFMSLQTWGTPTQCYDTIMTNCERIGAETYIALFSYAGMPWNEAERNMNCFTEHVLPRLKENKVEQKAA
jgi:hypothetical protein